MNPKLQTLKAYPYPNPIPDSLTLRQLIHSSPAHSPVVDIPLVAGLVTSVAVVLIGAILVAAICIKIRRSTTKTEAFETDDNPYHLGEYGLWTFVADDQLRAEGNLEKGFESSNFRVVKDAITQRVLALGMVMPARYITDAIRGLIRHHVGGQSQQTENLLTETELAMAENNERSEDAGVKAEMFWSSSLSIQGTELCSILNAAIRQDLPSNIAHAAVFAKGLEMRRNLIRENAADLSQRYPDVQATADMFPGGEFPESLEHQVTLTLTLLAHNLTQTQIQTSS